ncbi:MAG: histidinol-phosphate transaminase [Proteobacteria bacterium]|nr:histidinol-phosphate transaminase [Pseudomonadota bacterium]
MSGPAPKSTILDIKPYVPGKAKAAGFAAPLKLSANENALGCSPKARAAYVAAAENLHLYPDSKAIALREAIAAKHKLEADRIVLGTGSDEIFSLVCQAYLSPGDAMVQPHYAFAAWAIAAKAAGARVVSAPERDYAVDVDALLAAVDPTTRVVFVANPANPTGTCVPFADIQRLHAGLPEHVVLVLDAAYAEFAEGVPGYEDGMTLARTAPNVVLTRTFSKLHGLAALRIGWGYAAAPIVDALNRIRLPFNAATPAQAAAIAALGDSDFVARSLTLVREMRPRLTHALTNAGLRTLPSATNFVTALFPEGPEAARAMELHLAQCGILVRGLSGYDMPSALRVTIGSDPEMLEFECALRGSAAAKRAGGSLGRNVPGSS